MIFQRSSIDLTLNPLHLFSNLLVLCKGHILDGHLSIDPGLCATSIFLAVTTDLLKSVLQLGGFDVLSLLSLPVSHRLYMKPELFLILLISLINLANTGKGGKDTLCCAL